MSTAWLERVMAEPDVVVCLAPLTPRTRRMIGAVELDLLKTDVVFVNLSRRALVDPDALIARARQGDIRVWSGSSPAMSIRHHPEYAGQPARIGPR